MQFIVPFHEESNVEKLIKAGANGFVFQNDLITPRPTTSLDLEAMNRVFCVCKKHESKVYLQLTLMMHEMHIETVKEFLLWAEEKDIDAVLFADVGVYQLAKEMSIEKRLIYMPGSLTTNTYDATFWHKIGIKGVFIAREITKNDILQFEINNFEIGMIGHGYLNMFHSRRPLITNFMKYQDDEPLPLNQKNLTLIEEIRDESYKVVENVQGTHIFRSLPMQCLESINELKNVIDTFMIESLFETDEAVVKILEDYKSVLSNPETMSTVLEKYKETHDTGFLFKETVYNEF